MRTQRPERFAGFRLVLVGLVVTAVLGSAGCGSSTPSPGEAKHVVNQPSKPGPDGQPRSRTPRN